MNEIQTLEPAQVISRRIALEERHAEVSELENNLRGALDLASSHYIELVEEAAASGYPAPVFSIDDEEYAVFVTTLKHRHHSWQRYKETRILVCMRPLPLDGRNHRDWRTLHILAPDVDLTHACCHCDNDYFVKNVFKGSLNASPLQSAATVMQLASVTVFLFSLLTMTVLRYLNMMRRLLFLISVIQRTFAFVMLTA